MIFCLLQPRLGPKPFTPPKLNETESFDKVFSVPSVPCSKPQNGVHDIKEINTENGAPDNDNVLEEEITDSAVCEVVISDEVKDDSGVASTADRIKLFEVAKPQEDGIEDGVCKIEDSTTKTEDVVVKIEDDVGKSEEVLEEEVPSDYKPRTPSTAERRKLFENRTGSKENEPEDNFDSADASGNFERSSAQRTSIAERRKMYENRSQSVQETGVINSEKVSNSPVLLRRKGSFKSRKEEELIEENRKTMPMMKQQSMDPQAGRKSEVIVSAPTPKRTSTVFGRVSKFRHLKGTPAHKSFHIENIRNISRQIPGECDGFYGKY